LKLFQRITNQYRQGKADIIEVFYESPNKVPNKIRSKIFIHLCSLIDLLLLTPLFKIRDCLDEKGMFNWLSGKIASPFIKEWILAFVKWSWVGPLVFLFGLIIHAEGPITEGILYCLVQIPLAILGLITLFMPTPRRELEDMLFGRKLRKRKKVMIGSVETFRTSFEFDYDEQFDPVSDIYGLGEGTETIFPLRLFCAELPEGHVPRSSAPKFDLSFTLRIDPEEDPELAEAERNDLILSNFAVTEQELKQWKIRPKMALSESGVEAFTALAEAEPSMEFEVEYLFFSRLLTAIRPIEGYDCPDTVTDLLEKITKAANPWIKK
jgi:hypothetical protein